MLAKLIKKLPEGQQRTAFAWTLILLTIGIYLFILPIAYSGVVPQWFLYLCLAGLSYELTTLFNAFEGDTLSEIYVKIARVYTILPFGMGYICGARWGLNDPEVLFTVIIMLLMGHLHWQFAPQITQVTIVEPKGTTKVE